MRFSSKKLIKFVGSTSSSDPNPQFSMYRRMRQERKKRTEDDDVHSVISEARSQRSMVIDGGSVSSPSFDLKN